MQLGISGGEDFLFTSVSFWIGQCGRVVGYDVCLWNPRRLRLLLLF